MYAAGRHTLRLRACRQIEHALLVFGGVGEVGDGVCAVVQVVPDGAVGFDQAFGGGAVGRQGLALAFVDDFDGERFVLDVAAVGGDDEAEVFAFDLHGQPAAAAEVNHVCERAVGVAGLVEDVVGGGAAEGLAVVFAAHLGVEAGGEGAFEGRAAGQQVEGGEHVGERDGEGVDAVFLLLGIEIARVDEGIACGVAAAHGAAEQAAGGGVIEQGFDFAHVGGGGGLQADEGAAAVFFGGLLQGAGLFGRGAERPFAVDGFAVGGDLFDKGLMLGEADGDDDETDVVAGGEFGGGVAVKRHAVFFGGEFGRSGAAGGEPFDGEQLGQAGE